MNPDCQPFRTCIASLGVDGLEPVQLEDHRYRFRKNKFDDFGYILIGAQFCVALNLDERHSKMFYRRTDRKVQYNFRRSGPVEAVIFERIDRIDDEP